jgi:hypothetical protein
VKEGDTVLATYDEETKKLLFTTEPLADVPEVASVSAGGSDDTPTSES